MMSFRPLLAILLVVCVQANRDAAGGDRTITKVIKMLQEMVVKSKEDGERDVKLFAKFQCFCNSNQAEKTKEIADSGMEIEALGAQIGELQASSGKLSTENAQLMFMMQDNERARDNAQSLREKENDAFVAEEADMSAAIDNMDQAIETLSAIGADQTAKASLVSLKGAVSKKAVQPQLSAATREALKAASIFLTGKQRQTMTGFLQAPFTGEYQSQSGEIVGILKNMRDTFKSNLASARAAESSAAESHSAFMKVKEEEYEKQSTVRESQDKILGENDETLATKRTSKKETEQSKAEDEDFLGKLIKMCADKKAVFEDRKMIRANEEAAVAQAITILNSDEAFETMGAVKATTSGSTGPAFLQIKQHVQGRNVRATLAHKLAAQAKRLHSLKLARVAASLEAHNPFHKVVAELDEMLAVIQKEAKEDEAQKTWCDGEREDNNAQLQDKITNQEQLEGQIASLESDIFDAETGLKKQIADEETKLAENQKAQADETKDRGLENAAYQTNVRNVAKAQEILGKATKVLKKFYDWLHAKQGPHHYEQHEGKDSGSASLKRIPEASVEELEDACSADPACAGFNSNGYLKTEIDAEDKWYANPGGSLYVKVYDSESTVLLQKKEDPAPPDTFETGDESGSQSGKATDVVQMLTFITEEAAKEENDAHTEEMNSQHAFEDTINDLKQQEADTLDAIAELKGALAEKEKSHKERTVDHSKVVVERTAVEDYLLKIKGGCDFITDNFEQRTKNRESETLGLTTAKEELFATPAYKEAMAAEEKEALGACADKCMPEKDNAECQACIEGVSIAGYCSTHQTTPGCEEIVQAPPEF